MQLLFEEITVAAKDETLKDPERSYPWGTNTGTYKLWLTLISINIIALSVLFLINFEIPLIAELTNQEVTSTQSGSFVDKIQEYGMWVIVANVVTVWILKTVGRWLTVVEKWCRDLCKCKWYKPWCCLGRLFCWFVTVTKWITYVVAVASSVITSVLVWVSQQPNIQG